MSYRPLADELSRRGSDVEVADVPTDLTSPEPVMAGFVQAANRVGAEILVPHSNAGHYAPTVAREAGARSIVFMDAALPGESFAAPLAPPGLLDQVAGLADEKGWLPGWTRWWDRDVMVALLPDPAWLERIERQQPRAALDYFRAKLEAPAGWHERPCSYLAFGERYVEEVERARGHGWPVGVVDGNHLHYLSDPPGVADRIEDLLAELAGEESYRQDP